jgi:hypothetical protein
MGRMLRPKIRSKAQNQSVFKCWMLRPKIEEDKVESTKPKCIQMLDVKAENRRR